MTDNEKFLAVIFIIAITMLLLPSCASMTEVRDDVIVPGNIPTRTIVPTVLKPQPVEEEEIRDEDLTDDQKSLKYYHPKRLRGYTVPHEAYPENGYDYAAHPYLPCQEDCSVSPWEWVS